MEKLFGILEEKLKEKGYTPIFSPEEGIMEVYGGEVQEKWKIKIKDNFLINKIFAIGEGGVTFFELDYPQTPHMIKKLIADFELFYEENFDEEDDTAKVERLSEFLRSKNLSFPFPQTFIEDWNLYYLDVFAKIKSTFTEDFKEALKDFITIKDLSEGTMEIKDNTSGNFYKLSIEKQDTRTTQLLIGYKETSGFVLIKFQEKVSFNELINTILKVQASPDWVGEDVLEAINQKFPIASTTDLFPDGGTYIYKF